MGIRNDGREPDELRPLAFTRDYTELAMGSVLVEMGRTRVLCTASVEERVPPWLRGKGKGWVTAEYSMLPGSTPERVDREAAKGKQSGRTQEIQRLIGRSLRAVTDLVDARRGADHRRLRRAAGRRRHAHRVDLRRLPRAARRVLAARRRRRSCPRTRCTDLCAAISVGVVQALPSLDLDYSEDSTAEVDMNVVHDRRRASSSRCRARPRAPRSAATSSTSLLGLAERGIDQIFALQRELLAVPPARRADAVTLARIVLATANPDKAREIVDAPRTRARRRAGRRARRSCPRSRRPATTLLENARLKAEALRGRHRSWPPLADDTGLEVDALGGAPGCPERPLRRRGRDLRRQRRRSSLAELDAAPPQRRGPRGSAPSLVLAGADGSELVAEGVVEGVIADDAARRPRASGTTRCSCPAGGGGRTFAEMTLAEKQALSHRGRALRALAARSARG